MQLKKRHNVYRQIIALCFIALFIFVHAIKLTHLHPLIDSTKNCSEGKATTHVEQGNCLLCDYHFAKDSSCSNIFFYEFSSVFKYRPAIYLITSFSNRISILFQGRSPPGGFSYA
ncbi:MAG: hypothetical protein QM737_19265 [Ferruginibacter sp.]